MLNDKSKKESGFRAKILKDGEEVKVTKVGDCISWHPVISAVDIESIRKSKAEKPTGK